MKRVLAIGFAALLLTACAATGQAPGVPPAPPEPHSSVSVPGPSSPAPEPAPPESSSSEPVPLPEDSSSQPGEAVPAPEPDSRPLPPQGEVNPDAGFGNSAPDFGNEDYAGVVNRRADPLWEALNPALKAIEDDYSGYEVFVEDESLEVVLEIGVIHEDKVDRFLADWTGPAWDRVEKSPGSWSVAEQEAFAAAVAKLDLGPGVELYGSRELGMGEMVLVTIRSDDTVSEPQAQWDGWCQRVKDFAKERNNPVEMLVFMDAPSRPISNGSNPDT